MANVKEWWWDQDRRASAERVAQLNEETGRLSVEAETAKAQIAIAQKEVSAATERIAMANERAALAERKTAELNILLEKMKTWRTVSQKDANLIVAKLRAFSGTKFDAAIGEHDTEIVSLLETIEGILVDSGWVQVSWLGETVAYTRPGKPIVAFRAATGINILIHPASKSDLLAKGELLGKVLNDASVPAKARINADIEDANRDAIHIVVGKKTFPTP